VQDVEGDSDDAITTPGETNSFSASGMRACAMAVKNGSVTVMESTLIT
jgi:hypothetical protein